MAICLLMSFHLVGAEGIMGCVSRVTGRKPAMKRVVIFFRYLFDFFSHDIHFAALCERIYGDPFLCLHIKHHGIRFHFCIRLCHFWPADHFFGCIPGISSQQQTVFLIHPDIIGFQINFFILGNRLVVQGNVLGRYVQYHGILGTVRYGRIQGYPWKQEYEGYRPAGEDYRNEMAGYPTGRNPESLCL